MFAFTSYCQYFNCGFFGETSLSPAPVGGCACTVSPLRIFVWLIGWELSIWMCNMTKNMTKKICVFRSTGLEGTEADLHQNNRR